MITSCVSGRVVQLSLRDGLQLRRLPTFNQIGFHAFECGAQDFNFLFCFRGRQALSGVDERGGPT
jgi:hypothetical protein